MTLHKTQQALNSVSSFLDGSVIYGHNRLHLIANKPFLVEDDQFMLPKASQINDSAILGNKSSVISTGDLRGNDNPLLMAFHILFVKEHNHWAQRIARAFPDLPAERVFQEARRRVIAILQHITYDEYLPSLIGESLPAYAGYNEEVFPNVDHFFSAVGMRFAHSNIVNHVPI